MHCKQCGKTLSTSFDREKFLRKVCSCCGWIDYENPKPLVAGLLYEGNRLLWMRRATPPYEGCWVLPAGFMECGETISEAVCREIKEETGLSVPEGTLSLYSILSLPDIAQIYISLIGPLPSHDYHPTPEALEIALLDRGQVQHLKLGYPEATLQFILPIYDCLEQNAVPSTARMLTIRGVDSRR